MERGTAGLIVGVVIVLFAGAALLVGVAGGGTTTSVTTNQSVPFESIPTDGTAIIMARTQSGGLELFGAQLRGRDQSFDVGFAVPESCVVRNDEGDEELRDDLECTGLPAYGPVVGSGVTREGTRIVLVQIAVSEECYEAAPFEARTWPLAFEACREA